MSLPKYLTGIVLGSLWQATRLQTSKHRDTPVDKGEREAGPKGWVFRDIAIGLSVCIGEMVCGSCRPYHTCGRVKGISQYVVLDT
jgi:hypothetical protein